MKKKLLLVVVSLVLLIGLQACSTTSTTSTDRLGIVYPEKLAAAIEETGAKVAILVTETGTLSFYNTEGNQLKRCKLPGTESSDPKDPECTVFTKGQAVIGVKALPVLETKGSGCITFGPDGFGHYYEYCW